ncbi:MAG: choice-of-anchor D domain-containing protein, partial [Terracidiphilus sp.]
MSGLQFPSPIVSRRVLRGFRTISDVLTALAFVALLPQAWGGTPTFTVANTTFPSTAVGKSTTQSVTLTVNTAVPITSIAIAPNFTEYTIGAITGCTVDSTGNTVVAVNSVCTIPVTFTPKFPGTASAPPPISRSAPLLVTDVESGKPNGYSFALSGSATGSVFAFAPGYLTAFVGNSSFVGGFSAGCAGEADQNGDGCPATDALFDPPSMALDAAGNLFMSEGGLYIVNRVDAVTGIVNVYAGQYKKQGPSGSGGPALSAEFYNPQAIAVDQAENVYVDDPSGLWKINPASGIATIIAGAGPYSIGQGKPASETYLPYMGAILVDSAGNIYFTAWSQGTVYRIDAVTDLISVVAGSGTPAFTPTGIPGPGTGAVLDKPWGLAMDSKGNLYIGDLGNGLVYKVDTSDNISIYAGTLATSAEQNEGCYYDSGDWGPATSAFIGFPSGLAFDTADNLYIGEPGSQGGQSCPIRRVDAATGIIHTVAGDATQTYGFENNVGATDTYLSPNLVSVDGGGNIYVGQQAISSGVSKISPSQSSIIFPQQSDFVVGLQLVTASNVGIGPDITLSNYPFPIVPVPSTATPTPFSNQTLNGDTPQDCSVGTLPAGGVCGIQVAFDPVQLAAVSAVETVEDNSMGVAGTTNTISMTGSGFNNATASLTPSPLNFPSQPVGTPTAASLVTFSIFLNPLLTFESASISGPNASSFSLSAAASSPCTAGLSIPSGGGACGIGVIFTPQAGGALSATLNVTWLSRGVTYNLTAPINGTGAQLTPVATPVITPPTGTFNAPVAVAITDATSGSTIDYSTDGTTPSVAYSAPFTVSQTGTEVQAVASESGFTNATATPATYTIQPYLAFNPAAVGVAPGSAQTVTATVSLMGSTAPTAALHYGHDYSVGAVACTPLNGVETCTVPVTFVPTLPGARKDALILSISGTAVATVMLGGTGQAPFSLVQPGVVTNPVSGFGPYIYNSTVDENGTIYFLANNTVYSEPKSGGTPTNLNITGLSNPTQIAVDGAGTLYIAPNSDTASGALIVTYNPQTQAQGTISMVPPSPFQQCNTGYGPYYDIIGVDVDDLGNIYGLESSCEEVIELMTDGTFVVNAVSPRMNGISTLTVDATDNAFVTGYDIDEITAQGQSSQVNTTGASSIAVDAADTLYATRYSADGYDVAELAATNYSNALAGLDGGTSGEIVSPLGLGLGSDGTLYLGDYNDLDKVDRSQGAISFGEQNSGTASTTQTVSIYNGGNEGLIIGNIALTGAASGFTIITGSSSCYATPSTFVTVAPGALCQIAVNMTPPHAGNFTGNIAVTTNSLNTTSTTQNIALSGFVYGIYLTVSPNPVAFGNQTTGITSGVMTATVTNNGYYYQANVGGPSEVQTDGAFNPTQGACTVSLSAGQSCTFNITFDPSLAQPYSDTITFSGSSTGGGPNQTVTFGVTGTGVAPAVPVASLLPNPLAFGGQVVNSTSPAQIVTVSNTGNAPLTNIGPTITGANPSAYAITTGANACTSATSLSGSATCNIYVTFTPAATGSLPATLSVADNASPSPQTISLTGTGVSFVSNVGTAEAAQAVSVYFTTAGTLHSIQLLTQGTANLDFTSTTGGTCATGTAYIVGESCTVNVVFDPLNAGARSGSILLSDAGGNILGTGYLPGIGNGPEVVFTATSPTSLLTPNSYQPAGMAVDGSGNIYYSDSSTAKVFELPKSSSGYGTPVSIYSGLGSVFGVAVDGAGNVYIGDEGAGTLVKIP